MKRNAEFIKGVKDARQAPPEKIPWIFMAGRSNSGKSSLLNGITGVRGLARVSKTPGRTREANFFRFGDLFLVDLPGYGYAAGPASERDEWAAFIPSLVEDRRSALFLVLADIRRIPDELDELAVSFPRRFGVPSRIVLTKRDKVGRNESERSLREWRRLDPSPLVTSTSSREGLREATAVIDEHAIRRRRMIEGEES